MKVDVKAPTGESGIWAIEEFEISQTDAQFHNMRCAIKGHRGREVVAGTYKRLVRGNGIGRKCIMSNTPAEILDHERFFNRAEGSVLMAGLGLGVSLQVILENKKVDKVTVIELSDDVISLVGPAFADDPRVEIINADIFEWRAPEGVIYDAVWFDIWDDICYDNLEEMNKLHRMYRKRAKWHDSWCRSECKNY